MVQERLFASLLRHDDNFGRPVYKSYYEQIMLKVHSDSHSDKQLCSTTRGMPNCILLAIAQKKLVKGILMLMYWVSRMCVSQGNMLGGIPVF